MCVDEEGGGIRDRDDVSMSSRCSDLQYMHYNVENYIYTEDRGNNVVGEISLFFSCFYE